MYKFEHEDKQIKVLPLRLKTRQSKQTSTLILLSTRPSPPLIAISPSLSFTSHADSIRKSFLPSCRHHPTIEYSSFASAFASHKHVHKLHKKISDGINKAM